MKRRPSRQDGFFLCLLTQSGGGGGGSGFSIPTTPATSTATRPALNPNFTAGPTGLDQYRPWTTVVIDGEFFVVNGYDQPRRWDRTNGIWSYMGSAAPADFTPLSLTGAPGTAIPTGITARYYLVGYNSTLDKETAPQSGGDVTIANASGITKNVVIPWTAGSLPTEFDKRRIYRALDGTADYKLVATVADSAGTYTDTTADAGLATNSSWDGTIRTTLPPIFDGIAESGGYLFGWQKTSNMLAYSRGVRVSGVYVADDFPDANLLVVGTDESTGPPTAFYSFNRSDLIWKRKGIYEKSGDDIATWTITQLTAARGAFNQRCVVPLDRRFLCLDDLGLYKWTPGMYPGILGTVEETGNAPFQPFIDRMNVAASDTFFTEHWQENGVVVFWIALDYDPTPGHGLVYDYTRDKFIGIITRRNPSFAGRLQDANGVRHAMFGDDMGLLWEAMYAASEGVYAGDNTGTVTGGSTNALAMSGAALNTSILTSPQGAPLDRYSLAGTIVDENRVYTNTGTTITTYLYPTTAFATDDTFAVGIIAAVFETAQLGFKTRDIVFIREVWLEIEYGVAGSIRVDTAQDAKDFASAGEFALNTTHNADSSGLVRIIVPLQDRCKQWRLRISQRYANLGFSIQAIHIHYDIMEGKRD